MSLVRWDPFSDKNTFFSRMLPRAFGDWPPKTDAGLRKPKMIEIQ